VQITAKSGVGGVAGSCKRVEGCEAADVKSRPELNGNPCAIEGYDAEAVHKDPCCDSSSNHCCSS